MILVDANLLFYAHVRSFSEHERARSWLEGRLSGGSCVGVPWPSLLSFLRLVTNQRVFKRPLRMADAWEHVAALLAWDSVWGPNPVSGTLRSSAACCPPHALGRTSYPTLTLLRWRSSMG